MAELNRRQALISAYERYKIAAEALQEELRLSFSQPGLPVDRDLTLTKALVNFTFKNQYVLTRLERLVLGCYVGQPRVRRLSESICARMNAAGVREQPRTLESTSQQLENLEINEETRRAIMARPLDNNKAALREESTQQEVLQANAPTEEMEVAESSDSAKNAPTEDTEVAESSDSSDKTRSDDTAAQDMASSNLDPDKTD